jgi:hypothetical protein
MAWGDGALNTSNFLPDTYIMYRFGAELNNGVTQPQLSACGAEPKLNALSKTLNPPD